MHFTKTTTMTPKMNHFNLHSPNNEHVKHQHQTLSNRTNIKTNKQT